jgi:hypothetical protein
MWVEVSLGVGGLLGKLNLMTLPPELGCGPWPAPCDLLKKIIFIGKNFLQSLKFLIVFI